MDAVLPADLRDGAGGAGPGRQATTTDGGPDALIAELAQRLEGALGVLLLRRTRSHFYDELVAGIADGLDVTSYPVLSGIARGGPMPAARLASTIDLDRSGTSRHATRLETAGLLSRVPDPDDARATLLVLTADGEQAVRTMRSRLAAQFIDQLSAWPAKDARFFVQGLERFVAEVRAMAELAADGDDEG